MTNSKLHGDGLWHGFIMPEHKTALVEQQRERKRRPRPTLDEQEWEQIGSRLQESMLERMPITLEMYDPFESCQLTGIVLNVDSLGKRVRLLLDGEKQWVSLGDILNVQ
ncbi:YolD-like family protein [Paenibacillus apiarius]|uniref:YolD-like family protein n=1 Tax=Paenibacillus apiarius TaxID=46240 RepID=UPI003B3BD9D7